MTFRIGQGRSDEDKRHSAEAIYVAAEAWLSPAFQGRGVALSLALEELPPPGLSIKRFNTIRDHLGTEAAS